jgi:hypothetical protein
MKNRDGKFLSAHALLSCDLAEFFTPFASALLDPRAEGAYYFTHATTTFSRFAKCHVTSNVTRALRMLPVRFVIPRRPD